MTDIDTTAADMLEELITELARRGTELHFAELKGHVKDRLQVYGIYGRLGADHFHPTVGMAVRAYLAAYPDVVWQDWENDAGPPDRRVAGQGATRPARPARPTGLETAAAAPATDTTPPEGEPAPDESPEQGGIRRSASPREPREPGVDDPAGEA
jgi:hypothetical protein